MLPEESDDNQPILKQQHHSRHACTRTARAKFAGWSRVPRSTDLTSERSPPSRAAGSSWPYVLQERVYLNDIHTSVSQVDGGRGEQCGGHRVQCF